MHDDDPVLHIAGRSFGRVARRGAGLFDFKTLWWQARSQMTIGIATPSTRAARMCPIFRSAWRPTRRLTWLVMSCPTDGLSYPCLPQCRRSLYRGPLAHEFPRTVSRLNEMQSKEFLALERRMVDTGLT